MVLFTKYALESINYFELYIFIHIYVLPGEHAVVTTQINKSHSEHNANSLSQVITELTILYL